LTFADDDKDILSKKEKKSLNKKDVKFPRGNLHRFYRAIHPRNKAVAVG